MHSNSARFLFESKRHTVLHCHHQVHQDSDHPSRPTSKPYCDELTLELLVEHNMHDVIEWANHPTKQLPCAVEFDASDGGAPLHLRLEAAVCVGYDEYLRPGHNGLTAFICRLRIIAPRHTLGHVLFVNPWPGHLVPPATDAARPERPPVEETPTPGLRAAAAETTPPDKPAKGVKPIGATALQLIKLGLTPEEAKYVRVGAGGMLDKEYLQKGKQALGKVGGNYNGLLAIAESGKTVEIHVSRTFTTRTTMKPIDMGAVRYSSEFDEAWALSKDKWLKDGYTFEQFKAKHQLFSHEGTWSGFRGVTLVPDDAGGYGPAKGENIQVILNNNYAGASQKLCQKEMAATLAHETYGHALFKIQGKRWEHGRNTKPGPGSDFNEPLQNQISQRANEANRNFERHAH